MGMTKGSSYGIDSEDNIKYLTTQLMMQGQTPDPRIVNSIAHDKGFVDKRISSQSQTPITVKRNPIRNKSLQATEGAFPRIKNSTRGKADFNTTTESESLANRSSVRNGHFFDNTKVGKMFRNDQSRKVAYNT